MHLGFRNRRRIRIAPIGTWYFNPHSRDCRGGAMALQLAIVGFEHATLVPLPFPLFDLMAFVVLSLA